MSIKFIRPLLRHAFVILQKIQILMVCFCRQCPPSFFSDYKVYHSALFLWCKKLSHFLQIAVFSLNFDQVTVKDYPLSLIWQCNILDNEIVTCWEPIRNQSKTLWMKLLREWQPVWNSWEFGWWMSMFYFQPLLGFWWSMYNANLGLQFIDMGRSVEGV